VERWFAELMNKQLRRDFRRSVAQLKTAIEYSSPRIRRIRNRLSGRRVPT
jgi:hypothetical protein